MNKLILSCLLIASLSGCANPITETRGSNVELLPVTYSFKITTDDIDVAKSHLNAFVVKHPEPLENGRWSIKSAAADGTALYELIITELKALGVPRNHIEHEVKHELGQFDIEVTAINMNLTIEVCDQEKVDRFGRGHIGCYTEGSRWQSMVNPDKAI